MCSTAWRCVGLLLLGAGCAAPPVQDGAASGPHPDDGSPPADIGADPTLDANAVAAAVDHVFEVGLPDVWQIHDTYLDLLAAGDSECPANTTQLTGEGVGVAGCTSANGYFYLGVSTYERTETTDDTGVYYVNFLINGDFEIDLPAGNAFEVGGYAGHYHTGTPTRWAGESTVSGTWRLDGAAGALGAGISAALTTKANVTEEGTAVDLDGAAAAGSDSVQFEDVRLDVTNCDGRPTGTIRVREASGYWYTVALEDDCSGCGDATFFDGTSIGQVCIPLDGVADAILANMGHWQ